jgi:cytoskeletal protein RodZ
VNGEGKTIGELLRAAREEKKLSLEQVNRETKISAQTIRALEQDDFGAFSSDIYLKGFLRTYAQFLGLDGNRLWSMMAQRSQTPGAGSGPRWEIETGLREEKLGTPPWIKRLLLPGLVIAIVVLAILLVRERRKPHPAATGLRVPVATEARVASG